MASRRIAAIDLGAQSGRVAVGSFDGDRVELELDTIGVLATAVAAAR